MRYFDFLIFNKRNETTRYDGIAATNFVEAVKIVMEQYKTDKPADEIDGYNCCERTGK